MEPTNCPRCNSVETFATHKRPVGDDGLFEIYIRCTTCHWEDVLSYTTDDVETAKKQLSQLYLKENYEMQRYGFVSTDTAQIRERVRQRLQDAGKELTRLRREAGRGG